ncbi:molybdopterin cofactor biosynthesis protein [Bordetella pertussis]|nr:molybdopterin cofactor biosynthesis protein [Bordetella pertussis]
MLAALVRGMGAQVSHVLHARDDEDPTVSRLPLRTERPRQDSREEFLRVQWRATEDGAGELQPFGNQDSAIITSVPWSTGLARLPAGVPVNDGERVGYYDLRHWLT